jgi:hypothetical protein
MVGVGGSDGDQRCALGVAGNVHAGQAELVVGTGLRGSVGQGHRHLLRELKEQRTSFMSPDDSC